jgi:hypothetical protein
MDTMQITNAYIDDSFKGMLNSTVKVREHTYLLNICMSYKQCGKSGISESR